MKSRLLAGLGILAILAVSLIPETGCGGSSSSSALMVGMGVVMGTSSSAATALIFQGLSPIDDATVTVAVNSGTPVDVPNLGFGIYMLLAGPAASPGDSVTVVITRGGATITGTDVMPDKAVVTLPLSGSSHSAASPITVQWDAITSNIPDSVIISASSSYTVDTNRWNTMVVGTATSVQIPAGTLKPNLTGVILNVNATNITTDLGPNALFGSSVEIGNGSVTPSFNTTP